MDNKNTFFQRVRRRVYNWFRYDPFGFRFGHLLSFLLVPVILTILVLEALYDIIIEMAETTKYTVDDIIAGPRHLRAGNDTKDIDDEGFVG